VPGVVRTRVGYGGGTKENPTYHSLGDHSETLEVDFDPSVVKYEDLLRIYWESHDPVSRSWSRQYASFIFFHNEAQKRLALESKEKLEQKRGIRLHTEIVPYTTFFRAEGYHQKYYLQNTGEIAREYRAVYPADRDFTDSTATARANGYIGGYGSVASLEKEAARLGLSPRGLEALREIVKRRARG
jgi:peptide-methionine (S)-S-oxide reductase